jgi:hypothetical protein
MPLTINVGLSKKIGLPEYGSLGASCNVAFEATHDLLDDLDAFHEKVKNAYVACRQAVQDELVRNQQATDAANGTANGHASGNGTRANSNGSNGNGQRRGGGRRATASQVRALHAIAGRDRRDLTEILRARYGLDRPEDLSISEASELIDELKAQANGQGGRP